MFITFSKICLESKSRWFVGSSRIRKLAFESIILARATLPFSPPLNVEIFLKTSSPVNTKAARTFLILVFVRVGYVSDISSKIVFQHVSQIVPGHNNLLQH